MAEEKKEKKNRVRNAAGVFIPGGLLIGLGVGWAIDYLVVGLVIGLGGGFILYGLATLLIKD
jgi:hypothetical protein